jgi:hypothetical protein
MRSMLAVALLLSLPGMVQAQEPLPREEALKAAFRVCLDLPKMLDTPIPTDPDVKRPVGVHADNRGLMVLPESKLSLVDVAKGGLEALPVGQLWLLRLVPVVASQPAKAEQLKIVTFGGDKEPTTVALCALGIRKAADGKPELLVYGKGKEPLLHAALAKISGDGKQANPIEVSAEQQGDGALVTLKILGAYTATFPVGVSE